MSTKKNKDVKDDTTKKVGENMDEKANQNGEQKSQDEKDYFKIPKPKFPKLNKEVVLMWLKRIGVFLLGALTGAVAVVGAAMKVVNKNEEPEKDEFEDDGDEEEIEEETPSEDDEEAEA